MMLCSPGRIWICSSSNSIKVGWRNEKGVLSTNELNYLRDAQKMKIVLINQDDGTEVVQTVGLGDGR